MVIVEKGNLHNLSSLKIVWISFLILDIHLHKTSQLEILRNLARRGHNVRLIAVRSKGRVQDENLYVPVISVPLRYVPGVSHVLFSLTLFFFLPIYIIVRKPDIIVVEPDISVLGIASSFLFSKFNRIKLILDVRSTPVETDSFLERLRIPFFVASVLIAKKFFKGITIITPLMKEQVCKKFNIDPKGVGVWSSGVSATLFEPSRYFSEGEELKRKLGLSKNFIVFYHGVFTATRGLLETVKAMGMVKRSYPNITFFLLGTGPIVNRLKDLIRIDGLQDNVVIHSSVAYEDVPKYISMSDVAIIPLPNHPYWRCQCPLKLLEYLAMEKVVIATDIPAHRAVLGEAECGVYISSVSEVEIAKAIEYVYLNKDFLRERGKIGREIVERNYTWEKVAGRLEDYLLSIDRVSKK